MGIKLIISVFEKEGDDLVNMVQLETSDLDFFREALDVPDDDPLMYASYKIGKNANEKIFKRYGVKLDIVRFDCFAGYKSVQ